MKKPNLSKSNDNKMIACNTNVPHRNVITMVFFYFQVVKRTKLQLIHRYDPQRSFKVDITLCEKWDHVFWNRKVTKNKFSTSQNRHFTFSHITLERSERDLIQDIALVNGPMHIETDCLFQTASICPSKPKEIADLESQCLAEYRAMKRAKCNTTGKYDNKGKGKVHPITGHEGPEGE